MDYINYKSDIYACASIARKNGLVPVVDFVLATIRQEFTQVPQILEKWANQGTAASTMWGLKRDGWRYVREHESRLQSLVHYAVDSDDPVDAIDTLLEIPGLNTVKAAFVAQLYGLNVGCIDTHNAAIYDVDPASWVVSPTASARLRLAKIQSYVDFCQSVGPSEKWWGVWCEFMSAKYDSAFPTPEHVSRLHEKCLLI